MKQIIKSLAIIIIAFSVLPISSCKKEISKQAEIVGEWKISNYSLQLYNSDGLTLIGSIENSTMSGGTLIDINGNLGQIPVSGFYPFMDHQVFELPSIFINNETDNIYHYEFTDDGLVYENEYTNSSLSLVTSEKKGYYKLTDNSIIVTRDGFDQVYEPEEDTEEFLIEQFSSSYLTITIAKNNIEYNPIDINNSNLGTHNHANSIERITFEKIR